MNTPTAHSGQKRIVTISIKSIAYLIATEAVLIASSRLIGADWLESWVPVRLVTAFTLYFHPAVIIDGETAYDVRMWDAQVFYGVMICALLLTMTRTFSTRRKKSSFHAPED
ncbi:MAG: hypothetical protein LUG84_06675 [Akkermansiaceae bacterium]|nr:hypothetical protein [Akkermansiaceae bacterium]